jgi:hypothetical protein
MIKISFYTFFPSAPIFGYLLLFAKASKQGLLFVHLNFYNLNWILPAAAKAANKV